MAPIAPRMLSAVPVFGSVLSLPSESVTEIVLSSLTVRVPKNILTWIVYSIVGFLVLRAVSRLNLRSNENTY